MIGHLEAEIEFLIFHRKWWKFARPHEFWASAEILTGRASTTSRYSTGETLPIKAERPEPSDHLRSTCLRINTIYEDLNESSSARPGGSQQWKILPSPNSKRAPNFSAQILDRRGNFKGAEILGAQKILSGAEISTSAIALSHITRRMYVRLNFPQQFSAGIFRSKFPQQISAAIFRSNFPPEFSAWIFRLNFRHPPQFSWDAAISCIC